MSKKLPASVKNAWRDALRHELAIYEDKETARGFALRRIARRVIQLALAGDHEAYMEIANRLDGKPVQAITGPDGGTFKAEIEVNFVRPEPTKLEHFNTINAKIVDKVIEGVTES